MILLLLDYYYITIILFNYIVLINLLVTANSLASFTVSTSSYRSTKANPILSAEITVNSPSREENRDRA